MDLDDHKPFIWRKKYEEKGVKVEDKEIEAETRRRIEKNKAELEAIKERQRQRDLEIQQKINDEELLQRQKEAQEHEHWSSLEDYFVLKQQRLKSKIRIRDGRAKPVDMLAYYIEVFGAELEDQQRGSIYLKEEDIDISDCNIELVNPCEWLTDLDGLEEDIREYMKTDCEENNLYWQDLLDVIEYERFQSKHTEKVDIAKLFEGRTVPELDDYEDEMRRFMNSHDPSVDVDFYKNALLQLIAIRARMRITLNHKKNLKYRKDKILQDKKPQDAALRLDKHANIKQEPVKAKNEDSMDVDGDDNHSVSGEESNEDEKLDDHDVISLDPSNLDEAKRLCIEEYERDCYTPEKYTSDQLDSTITYVNYEDDYKQLVQKRSQISRGSALPSSLARTNDPQTSGPMSNDERSFLEAARKDMDTNQESTFSCEAAVRGQDNRAVSYSWSDRYQPRKPRYFNRVHTGFEWNKYNQTHYDIDNPPPKVVQGYKFNIFYPDLIDKSKAPTFSLTPCKDEPDFKIIRFSAGPPYEDIAFKIVSRDWNNSDKSGYRCQFVNNVLQLWFQFKRYRYRR